MLRLPKLYLWLSSVCVLTLIASCSISKYKHPTQCNRVFITKQAFQPVLKESSATKFKATIDVLKNHLSGILIVKQTDSVSTHLIFVTELGMKMFDFEWKNGEIKPVYVFEPLNKSALINVLLNNFKYIFLLDVYNSFAGLCTNKNLRSYYELEGFKHRYIVADTIKGITSQNVFNKNKKSCVINYTFVSQTKTYSTIKCTQFGLIKIRTELNAIE